MEKVNLSGEKLKKGICCWDHAKFSYEKHGAYGFSWQQRNYRCSFCNKEFRSAQALGGHMNIHRRDRARMRLSPSSDGLNSTPHTNPNFGSPSSALSADTLSSFAGFSSPISSASTATATAADADAASEEQAAAVCQSECDDHRLTWARRHVPKNLSKRALLEVKELPILAKRTETRVWKKKEVVRLDLNMGFFRDAKDDLDLELRLGLS
ncbi:transcriptional regulator SUPERMAN-like [Coffea eugenioides]|uniref:Transcriptional regulator SUPERMAN n=1 Tax=Coffea arabica TaxID=13443 RepID=A0A6P6SZD5_COFAR|nr:transcriptional regulator SUPERMAN-like [Coffea arabica]XP_027174364.1 transcriptional regulator SUPERMAN-like [Coffea eugenioides]